MYRTIDQEKTGRKIKEMLLAEGYDAKYLQEYLQLGGPQSVYRWFQGRMVPSIDNLLAISDLLGVHVEELLVFKE